MNTYFLVYEDTPECDWVLYDFSDTDCNYGGSLALARFDEPDFHEAHLCNIHGPIVLWKVEEGEER